MGKSYIYILYTKYFTFDSGRPSDLESCKVSLTDFSHGHIMEPIYFGVSETAQAQIEKQQTNHCHVWYLLFNYASHGFVLQKSTNGIPGFGGFFSS